jgi:hypothetical protein
MRIVLMTPDHERGKTGTFITERVVRGEKLVCVLLDGEKVPVHYPAEYVRAETK